MSPPSRRFGKARQASSKDDSSDSGQENNFVTDQDTMVTSRSGTTIQLPPRPSSPEENDDMIKNDGLMQKLKKVFIIDDLQFIIIYSTQFIVIKMESFQVLIVVIFKDTSTSFLPRFVQKCLELISRLDWV